jgi:alkyl hydroperoxide reductase subunit AhpC
MSVSIGKPAPDFEAKAWQRGAEDPETVALSAFRGKWVVLFFYPHDFTVVCPTELSAFAIMAKDFEGEDAVLIGATTDSFLSHKAWFESDPRLESVQYPVLADTERVVSDAFGVLLEDGSAARGTFILDPDGVVRHITVNGLGVGRNVDETLRVLRALRTGELCPVAWQPGQSTLSGHDEWLAKALPRLPREALAEAAKELQTIRYAAGDIVFREGDPPDRFYIITAGEVEVIRPDENSGNKVITTLQSGEFFGEIGLFTEARRGASVRAKTDLEALAMDRPTFWRVVASSQNISADLAQISRERLARG